MSDLFLLSPMDYSSAATDYSSAVIGWLYFATNNIPGATDEYSIFIVSNGLLICCNSPSTEELVKTCNIDRYLMRMQCDGAKDLQFFETTSNYDYDHTGYIDFSTSSECFACKCQDCNVKHDRVINAINALTASVKEITSKRGVILSKRISYPYTLLEIKVDVIVEATAEEHNITVDNPLTASKKKEKIEPILSTTARSFRTEECLINIIKGFSIPAGLPWHLVDEVYIPINYGDEFHWVLAIVILKERDCSFFVAAYAEYLSDELQVPNDVLDAGLLCKGYIALLLKYGEAKAQKLYTSDSKDP
ncbi:hypothetical protein FXO37_35014 [Capsicum annuum]|nr:hypothetical protein FXO37_35014 [Capsicum annuum]